MSADGAPTAPGWAERARTALAQARVGTLSVRSCRAGTSATATVVAVDCDEAGRPLVWLEESSPTASALGRCGPAALVVHDGSADLTLRLVGVFRPVGREGGRRAYRADLLSVRLVGHGGVAVAVEDFAAASPDPLREVSADVLRHLERAHTAALVSCVRAHGLHDALAVVPRGLTRYGLRLGVIGEDGVDEVVLAFPDGPVDSLADLPAGFRVPLSCRCGAGAD
ncbi:DUF2470 domain-containing protein [Nocardioides sp. GY 10127]|uniref:DUF2470 domain-containing protein n=1 Tax=Nocardioides sp. GY 10127 TaxID=2569762 RepID=UPI0010A882CA|nr:DUF2470 domain-containing protein [Nocardioides sp. GY 10127]TIC80807.1 DUF2470 domain-containing protein [Nocardioides sp. GY 10127]